MSTPNKKETSKKKETIPIPDLKAEIFKQNKHKTKP